MIFPPPPRASRRSLETAIAVAVAAIASVNHRKIFISNVLPPMKRPSRSRASFHGGRSMA
jgi:hypothetical protein